MTVGQSDFRFSIASRLRKAADYATVFSSRRVLHGRYFALHFNPVDADSALGGVGGRRGPRLGLVVAKRLARRAVLRNLIKRLARESFRLAQWQLPPMDLVLRLEKTVKKPGHENLVEAKRNRRQDVERPDDPSRFFSLATLKSELRADIERLLARLPRTASPLAQECKNRQ